MNLKKLANWSWKDSLFLFIGIHFLYFYDKTPVFLIRKQGLLDSLKGEAVRLLFRIYHHMEFVTIPIPARYKEESGYTNRRFGD